MNKNFFDYYAQLQLFLIPLNVIITTVVSNKNKNILINNMFTSIKLF